MKEQYWIRVTDIKELFTSIAKKKNVTVVERVSDLEGVDSISVLGLNLFLNFRRGQSVFVQPIIKHDSLGESGCATNKEVSLRDDSRSLWVIGRPRAKCP